jgi:hypothetical protein
MLFVQLHHRPGVVESLTRTRAKRKKEDSLGNTHLRHTCVYTCLSADIYLMITFLTLTSCLFPRASKSQSTTRSVLVIYC